MPRFVQISPDGRLGPRRRPKTEDIVMPPENSAPSTFVPVGTYPRQGSPKIRNAVPGGTISDVPTTPAPRDSVPPPSKGYGTMAVLMTMHGGANEMMKIMNGLVEHNAKLLRQGKIPRVSGLALANQSMATPGPVRYVREPYWRDGVNALLTGRAGAGTIAAWRAAEAMVDGLQPELAMVGGVPVVSIGGTIIDLSPTFGRLVGDAPGLVGAIPDDPNEGRVTEYLALTIDDPNATSVRYIGDAIAQHNARRIRKKRLPALYNTRVRYQTEGSPERWWDAEEILAAGRDDCEGLAAYRAGDLITNGIESGVYTRKIDNPNKAGSRIFHALTWVRKPDGSIAYDDPSVRLGMPIPKWYAEYAAKRRAAGQPL